MKSSTLWGSEIANASVLSWGWVTTFLDIVDGNLVLGGNLGYETANDIFSSRATTPICLMPPGLLSSLAT